ncbi:unnamed protein product [Heligmosomoides polygyrus]|uniref:G_PROTEIN_RECEP_F1_2 domain-containing protein n=1 Tax=Heligmosomoides polygyrus TaxID=6339 RepID=A0A183FIU9_HELPZ|nr:unnamed protein product [Heligmosomoides polygyrus]
MTLRLPTMKNSFGRLLSSQSTGEAILCSTFAFLYSPMHFSELNVLKDSSRRLGMILLICYDICIYSHLFIALNRLVAICLPLQYKTFFSRKNTKAFIAASWVGAVIPALIMYGYSKFLVSNFTNAFIWTFVFTQTEVSLQVLERLA